MSSKIDRRCSIIVRGQHGRPQFRSRLWGTPYSQPKHCWALKNSKVRSDFHAIFRGIVRLNRPKHRSFPSMTRFSIWFLFLLKRRLSQSQQRNSHVASQHHTDIEVKQLTEEKYWITKHIQNYCWYWNIAHQHFWCLQKDILLVYLCFFFQDVKEIRCLSPLSTIISKLPTFRWGLLHPIELPLNAHQFKYPGSYPIQIPTISH